MVSKKQLVAGGLIIGGIAAVAVYLSQQQPKPTISCPSGTYYTVIRNNYSVPATVTTNKGQSIVVNPGQSQELCLAEDTTLSAAYGVVSVVTPPSPVEIILNGPGRSISLRYLS